MTKIETDAMLVLLNKTMKPLNVRKKLREPPNVRKKTFTCDFKTTQCENKTIKCEKKKKKVREPPNVRK